MRVGGWGRVGAGYGVGGDRGRRWQRRGMRASAASSPAFLGSMVFAGALRAALESHPRFQGGRVFVAALRGAVESHPAVAGLRVVAVPMRAALESTPTLAGTAVRVGVLRAALESAPALRPVLTLVGQLRASLASAPHLSGAAILLGVMRASLESDPTLLLERGRLRAVHARLYLDTTGGVVPTVGGLPAFARASSAPGEDPMGREISALPNTPRFAWGEVDGSRRALLKLQGAGLLPGGGVRAAERLSYPGVGAMEHAIYLRHRIDYNPATAAGHLLWLASLTGAAPHVRLRYSAGRYYAQLHNGAAAREVSVPIRGVAGSLVELLVSFSVTRNTVELVQALGGDVLERSSGAMPAGGMPGNWSGDYLVLNGYDQHPGDAAYAEVKVLDPAGFETTEDRLREAREYWLTPAGDLVTGVP